MKVVQIINRKCHELKVQIADLRRLHPDEAVAQSLDEAEQAARMYDANAATGNEVVDVVLTEKSLLCEAQHIRLNCVADGTCLAALEPGDLYALFSNLLDQAIDAAAQYLVVAFTGLLHGKLSVSDNNRAHREALKYLHIIGIVVFVKCI